MYSEARTSGLQSRAKNKRNREQGARGKRIPLPNPLQRKVDSLNLLSIIYYLLSLCKVIFFHFPSRINTINTYYLICLRRNTYVFRLLYRNTVREPGFQCNRLINGGYREQISIRPISRSPNIGISMSIEVMTKLSIIPLSIPDLSYVPYPESA